MKSSDASLARIKISEILNCLRRFDLFRSENNKRVQNTATPIFKMASLKVKTLEKKCMEFYAEKILQQFDPDFFDEADNVKEFENLTLGKAPTPEKIKQMRERWQSQA